MTISFVTLSSILILNLIDKLIKPTLHEIIMYLFICVTYREILYYIYIYIYGAWGSVVVKALRY